MNNNPGDLSFAKTLKSSRFRSKGKRGASKPMRALAILGFYTLKVQCNFMRVGLDLVTD